MGTPSMGTPGMGTPGMDLDQVAAVLERKAAELDAQTGKMTERPTDQGSISFGKRVGDGTSMAVERLSQVAAHESLVDLRAVVARAQAKLADGTYGLCDVCGEPIGEGRLEVRPWAVVCVEHADQR